MALVRLDQQRPQFIEGEGMLPFGAAVPADREQVLVAARTAF